MHGTTEPEHYAVSKNISDGQAEKKSGSIIVLT